MESIPRRMDTRRESRADSGWDQDARRALFRVRSGLSYKEFEEAYLPPSFRDRDRGRRHCGNVIIRVEVVERRDKDIQCS